MTSDPRRREMFMNIAASPANSGLSPEEIRIQDYLKAYTETGRPPVPVPQEPAGESERAALGLPPLFQPHVEGGGSDTFSTVPVAGASSSPTPRPRIMDASKLPQIHKFQPVIDKEGDTYCNISALPDYGFFSNDELRVFAYAKGLIYSPEPLPTDPPAIRIESPSPSTSTSPSSAPYFTSHGSTTAYFEEASPSALTGQPSKLYYQSISAGTQFDRHCFEELRIAFLKAGSEVDSNALLGPAAITTPSISTSTPGPTLFGGTSTSFSQPHPVRPW